VIHLTISALILRTILIGVGATILIDAWAVFLRRTFGLRSLDYCLLGRWLLHMPGGKIMHESIATATRKPNECTLGWITHYTIGIGFAILFVLLVSDAWLAHPTLLPALGFGVVTVVVPFFTMQPALGLGIAASRTPNPTSARLKSLMTHTMFGLGLYVSAYLLSAAVNPAQLAR
jgi:hypothetical protein